MKVIHQYNVIEITVKRKYEYRLKIKISVISKIIVSKHYDYIYEPSCQLPVLRGETHTFIINMFSKLINNAIVTFFKRRTKIGDRYVMHVFL